jgi:hypothetical protein
MNYLQALGSVYKLVIRCPVRSVRGRVIGDVPRFTNTTVNINIDLTHGLINGTITPASNATGWNNADASIALYFNQPIDTGKLLIKVYETVYGNTCVDMDPPGTDALAAKGYELAEVHRDHEAVPSGLSLLPNNRAVVFLCV